MAIFLILIVLAQLVACGSLLYCLVNQMKSHKQLKEKYSELLLKNDLIVRYSQSMEEQVKELKGEVQRLSVRNERSAK